jgi:hypothetical protein
MRWSGLGRSGVPKEFKGEASKVAHPMTKKMFSTLVPATQCCDGLSGWGANEYASCIIPYAHALKTEALQAETDNKRPFLLHRVRCGCL